MASSALPRRQTLSTDLMACLGQEDMADMHLLGADGTKVPAFRTILACRSAVFRKMLLGDFEESKSNVVKLSYDGDALRALVEFCVTDDVLHFEGRVDEFAARGIVQLIACGHFLNMPLLQEKARTLANAFLGEYSILACAFYDEASLFGEPTESIKGEALAIIRKNPGKTLLRNPSVLRPEGLRELISDDGMLCEEITLFRALNEWTTAMTEDDKANSSPSGDDRLSFAKNVAASHIRLSSIRPSDLVGIVRKSGLVDEKMISEAFEAQALFAEKDLHAPFSKKRKMLPGITVSGAGVNAVNGFYEENGEYYGHPKYTKTSSWQGRERTFCIYRFGAAKWYIAIVAEDGGIGAGKNDFYSHPTKQKSVPSNGWEVSDQSELGCAPCPTCQKS